MPKNPSPATTKVSRRPRFSGSLSASASSSILTSLGFRFKGLIAWLPWRGVYITKFPGLDGQLRLIADWVLDVFLPRDIMQLRLFHEEAVHREHFESGETVFGNGDFGDKVYFIVKGEATVERDGGVLAMLRGGDVFGEATLISDKPRNATIRATTSLDTVSRNAFQELLMHLPGLNSTMQELMSGRTRGDATSQEMPREGPDKSPDKVPATPTMNGQKRQSPRSRFDCVLSRLKQ